MSTSDIFAVYPGFDGIFGVLSVRSTSNPVGKVIHSEFSRNGIYLFLFSNYESFLYLYYIIFVFSSMLLFTKSLFITHI